MIWDRLKDESFELPPDQAAHARAAELAVTATARYIEPGGGRRLAVFPTCRSSSPRNALRLRAPFREVCGEPTRRRGGRVRPRKLCEAPALLRIDT